MEGYKLGTHPKSLANLRPGNGRPPTYEEKKVQHSISVTNKGWNSAKAKIQAAGYKSISEFLEMLGREEVQIGQPPREVP